MKIDSVKNYICRTLREWRWTILLIVFVVIPVKSSLADWNWVPTGSMNPTIFEGDLVYVNKAAYDLRIPLTLSRLAKWSDPARGDIVICFSPEDNMRLVKRVVGVAGDIIELKKDKLYLNNYPLSYAQLSPENTEYLSDRLKKDCLFALEDLAGISHAVMITPQIRAMRNFGPVTIPDGSYFIMGDNRDNSKDSRYFGCVQRKSIVGRAQGVICSFDINNMCWPRIKRFFTALQ